MVHVAGATPAISGSCVLGVEPHGSALRTAATLLALLPLFGCNSEATRKCQQQFQSAQVIVQNQSSVPAGLDASIAAVDVALSACRLAERDKEVEQLQLARSSLAAHLESVKQHPSRPKRAALNPSEISELVKRGDPQCPKGMAYNVEGSDQQVKCTGLVPMLMNWGRARDYYSKLGFHVTTTDGPSTIRAERGSELYILTFDKPDDTQPPRCLKIYPEPNVPWQEAVGRVTGVPLIKLRQGSPVPMPSGNVPLRIDEGKDKLIVYLGHCDSHD